MSDHLTIAGFFPKILHGRGCPLYRDTLNPLAPQIGQLKRTLFIFGRLLDTDIQRRAQIGLKKGGAQHALKNALRIRCQGDIRDQTAFA